MQKYLTKFSAYPGEKKEVKYNNKKWEKKGKLKLISYTGGQASRESAMILLLITHIKVFEAIVFENMKLQCFKNKREEECWWQL